MRVSSESALPTHADATQRIEFGSVGTSDGSYRSGAMIRAFTSSNTTSSGGAMIDLVAPTVRSVGSLEVSGTVSSSGDLMVGGTAYFGQNIVVGTCLQ